MSGPPPAARRSLAGVQTVARPSGQLQRPVVLTRPGAAERIYVVLTMFLLAYALPNEWFTEATPAFLDPNAAAATNESQGPLPTIIFGGLFGFGLLQLLPNAHIIANLIRRERLLPLFVGLALVSTLWASDPSIVGRRSLAFALTTTFGFYLVMRFDLGEIVRYAGVALAIGTVLNVIWINALPTYGVTPELAAFGDDVGAWKGVFPQKNSLGVYSVLAVFTFLILARSHRRYRSFYYPLAAVNVWLVVGADSKTSLVSSAGLAVMLLVYLAFRSRKTLFGAVAISMTSVTIASTLIVTLQLRQIAELLGRDVTLTGRTALWESVISEIAHRPWFGVGWSGYWNGWFSPSHEVLIEHSWLPPHAHNAMLDYALQLGIFGAAVFLALFVRSVIRATRHIQAHRGPLGLWPLGFLSFTLMFSVTESGFIGRTLPWVLLVVAILTVTSDTRESRMERFETDVRTDRRPLEIAEPGPRPV